MKTNVALPKETLCTLRNLIAEIDFEESHMEDEECDSDIVVENLYKIVDILRPIIGE